MEKTILTIKTDKKVKQEAQEAARELGLPLGTIVNAYLRELAREKRVVFSVPPLPNARLKALLKDIKKESTKRKKNAKLFNYKEAVEHLDKL
jgi:addiction module RelB/DinJ family antitoxin